MTAQHENLTNLLPHTDRAYYAGLIDGEGCIAINKITQKTYKRPGFQLRISVCMTDYRAIRELHDVFGGTIVTSNRTNGKTAYQWAQTANGALSTLEILQPYLRVKRKQANICIRFQKARQSRKVTRSSNEEWNQENLYHAEMKKLNERWTPEWKSER